VGLDGQVAGWRVAPCVEAMSTQPDGMGLDGQVTGWRVASCVKAMSTQPEWYAGLGGHGTEWQANTPKHSHQNLKVWRGSTGEEVRGGVLRSPTPWPTPCWRTTAN
jgi:hypothetical protein